MTTIHFKGDTKSICVARKQENARSAGALFAYALRWAQPTVRFRMQDGSVSTFATKSILYIQEG